MKRITVAGAMLTAASALLVFHAPAGASQPSEEAAPSRVRVGIFDSRALALAYYRSEGFRLRLQGMKAEYAKARAAGDENRVKELDREGPMLQDLIHKQSFSTWPVDSILKRIKDEVPEIARQAGVDVIVSRWDVVYQRSENALVNVTDLMVKLFHPDESTVALIHELRTIAPVPLQELKDHQD